MALGERKRKKAQFTPPKLMLTSMMDMFTIILIFLLFSFSSDSESIKNMRDLELPVSSAQVDYSDSIRIVLSSADLKLNGEALALLDKEKIVGVDTGNLKDSSLFRKLKELYDEQAAHEESDEKKRHILFMCDRRHSFKTINTVIKTAGLAGFLNFQFAVLEERSE